MPQAINNWQMDRKTDFSLPAPKPKYRSAFKTLAGYARPHAGVFLLAFICTLIAIAAELLQPYLVKIAIDDNLLAGRNDYGELLVISAVYLALSGAALLFSYLQNNLLQYAGQSIVARIRKQLFAHIARQSMAYFDRTPSGSLITHISSDTEAINQFFNQVMLSLLRDGMTLVFIFVMMFHLDAELALYCLIILPVIAAIALSFRSFMRKTYQTARTRLSRLVSFVAENLSGMHLIQMFQQQREQGKQFEERNEDYFRANVREIRTNVLFNRTFDILSNLAIAAVTWFGGRAVLDGAVEFGVLYAFITYIRQFFQPINALTQQWNTLQSATVAVSRIWSVFDVRPAVTDAPDAEDIDIARVKGRVAFNRVSFGYEPGTTVIRNLDLAIEPGRMIGIVGSTGAGKSSLISLLCRFYDVTEGSVEIDGIDIRRIPQAKLHRIVGLVQQEPYLFAGTIIDNVRLFDESISREDVIRACELVGVDPLIRRMKDGYDTLLSERGAGLSAGERQLVSFARIVVFRPKILILDEATANLDSETEQLLQRALHVVSEGRTTIVIAHRLSTVMQADRILVIEKGEIIEQGTHEALIALGGHYAELYRHAQGKRAEEERLRRAGELLGAGRKGAF
mgnify:FL=1